MAIKIRNITIKAVNDSKNVIDIVFIAATTSITTLMSLIFLGDHGSISIGFIAIALLIGATGIIILTFVPKVGYILILSMISSYID